MIEAALGAVRRLAEDLCGRARASGHALIGEPRIARKREIAAELSSQLEAAFALEAILTDGFGAAPLSVRAGPAGGAPASIAARAAECRALLCGRPVAESLLGQIEAALGSARMTCATAGAPQPGRAPRRPPIDPIFSLTLPDHSAFGPPRTEAELAPHFWLMAFREARVADLCALTLCEHGGMPLRFYRELARQTWDELRHACFFLACADDLLEAFVASAGDSQLGEGARTFLRTGVGLPLPAGCDLYPALWPLRAPHRIALLQAGDEADLPAQLTADLDAPFFRARPKRAAELRWTIAEEEAHVRFGARWLEALEPDAAERQALVDEALKLRGVLVASARAEALGVSLASVLPPSTPGTRPACSPQPAGG